MDRGRNISVLDTDTNRWSTGPDTCYGPCVTRKLYVINLLSLTEVHHDFLCVLAKEVRFF